MSIRKESLALVLIVFLTGSCHVGSVKRMGDCSADAIVGLLAANDLGSVVECYQFPEQHDGVELDAERENLRLGIDTVIGELGDLELLNPIDGVNDVDFLRLESASPEYWNDLQRSEPDLLHLYSVRFSKAGVGAIEIVIYSAGTEKRVRRIGFGTPSENAAARTMLLSVEELLKGRSSGPLVR